MRKNCHFLFTWLPYHVKKLNIEYPRRAKLWKGRSTFCFSSIFLRHAPPIKRYSPTNRLSSFWLLKLKLIHQIPNSVAQKFHVRITLVESDFFYHAAFAVLRPHKCWMTINQFLGIFQKTFWGSFRSPLFAIYKGIAALYWPSIINYQQPPPNSALY